MGRGKSYSDVEVAAALRAVDANRGLVRPTATMIGVPYQTLQRWKDEGTDQAARARRLTLGSKVDQNLADRWLDIVLAAQERVMEALPKASAQQAIIVAGVSFDKRQVILGRPTSVSASMVRYVAADSLQQLASRRLLALSSGEAVSQRGEGGAEVAAPSDTRPAKKRQAKGLRLSTQTKPVQASTRYVKESSASSLDENESAPGSPQTEPNET